MAAKYWSRNAAMFGAAGSPATPGAIATAPGEGVLSLGGTEPGPGLPTSGLPSVGMPAPGLPAEGLPTAAGEPAPPGDMIRPPVCGFCWLCAVVWDPECATMSHAPTPMPASSAMPAATKATVRYGDRLTVGGACTVSGATSSGKRVPPLVQNFCTPNSGRPERARDST